MSSLFGDGAGPTIVSGGQTGVDRAALDAALTVGLPVDGWCPADRWAEDGPIAERYPLRPTPSRKVIQRTRWNVRDSDATLIVHAGIRGSGTVATIGFAERLGRPWREVDLAAGATPETVAAVVDWLVAVAPARLNVAGPRESTSPGVGAAAEAFLAGVFRRWRGGPPPE